jgi:hypothetical protein
MKVEISIEFDKELTDALMDTFGEFSREITGLRGLLDKADLSVSTEIAPEPKLKPTPKAKPEQIKPAVKRKKRPKQTLRGTVLKLVKQNKDGISRKELLEKTGFSKRQITDYVYQLKKMQKIEATKDGLFKPL